MSGKLTKFRADLVALASLIREAFGDLGGGDDPKIVHGYLDRQKRVKRIIATYPNGWTIRLSFNVKGDLTAQSASIKLASVRCKL